MAGAGEEEASSNDDEEMLEADMGVSGRKEPLRLRSGVEQGVESHDVAGVESMDFASK